MIDDRHAADEPMLLTIRETARALSCCEKTIWSLTRAGRLRAVHVTPRSIRYDVADIRAFIAASKGANL